jgi:DNA-binding transcriptional ArsR family regulator
VKSNQKSQAIAAAVPKVLWVWHIVRFRERWEMSGEYERKMGLEYLRLFIAAGGQKSTESTQFLAQLAELRHYYPKEYYHLRGVLDELSALAGTMERKFRGYLLNARLQPATLTELAARLDLPRDEMLKALKSLERVGLVERVPMPEFADDPDEDRREDRDEESDRCAKRGTGTRGRKATRAHKTWQKCASSEDSETFPNNPEAFDELANDQTKRKIPNGQVAKGQAKGEGQAPTSPAATPPEGQGPRPGPARPQEVSDEGPRHQQPAAGGKPAYAPLAVSSGPRIVPLHGDGDARPIGDLLPRAMDGLAHGQAVRADDFAVEIFGLLRAPFDANSRDGVRELGNYRAAWLDAIDAGLSSAQMDELRAKARKDAMTIGSHRKRYYANDGSPEQYWRFLLNKHLDARRRGKPEARAGPASAAV